MKVSPDIEFPVDQIKRLGEEHEQLETFEERLVLATNLLCFANDPWIAYASVVDIRDPVESDCVR